MRRPAGCLRSAEPRRLPQAPSGRRARSILSSPKTNPMTTTSLPVVLQATPSAGAATQASVRFLDHLFAKTERPEVAIRLWDGTCWPDGNARPATLQLNHPGALRRMFSQGTEMGLAEAYLHNDFDIAGEFEAAFEMSDVLAKGLGWAQSLQLANLLRQLPGDGTGAAGERSFSSTQKKRHTLTRDREAVSFHYDISNDFYKLWLDSRMVYSCAYFQQEDQHLESAQTAKFSHLCRKLQLRPGQRVLDIGCGWGGFAVYATKHHRVQIVGVTLSGRQYQEGVARAEQEGLSSLVNLQLLDYREIDDPEGFDAIVSVGMAEHVGLENLPAYFRTVHDLLKPGGLFLNHAIGEGPRYRPSQGPSFINEYVFPDTDLPPIRAITTDAEAAGFEVRDVENLREHYALTLRHWGRRLAARHEEALQYVNEPTYRVWRLYMAGSAHAFEYGGLALYQTLLAKLPASGQLGLPLTRRAWYEQNREMPCQ